MSKNVKPELRKKSGTNHKKGQKTRNSSNQGRRTTGPQPNSYLGPIHDPNCKFCRVIRRMGIAVKDGSIYEL